jgi:UDP-N-acetylmuramoylalanine--D-glutamate ligase
VRPVRAVEPQDPVIPEAWRRGEVAVIGIARSGLAAGRWLLAQGLRVYASDAGPGLGDAPAALRAAGAAVDTGGHDLARIGRAAAAIVSPGVPPDAAPVRAARQAGVPLHSEIDLGARALTRTRLAVVTGTNGKSTTTALVAHLLSEGGLPCPPVGNIGRPLIELALDPDPPPWAAVEVSSFQLHDSPGLVPAVGVLTNLAPDHLDRYPDVESYYADKRLLFRNATADSVWVLNGDDPAVLELAGAAAGIRRRWRTAGPADAWLDRAEGALTLDGAPLLPRDRLPLLGDHNVENALAGALVARAAGVPPDRIARGLTTFRGLPHRLETVATVGGVVWINDSKATNVASAAMAIRAMERPFVLLMGGKHKGQPYTPLVPLIGQRCRGVIAFGEAAPLIDADLRAAVRLERVETLKDAAARAREWARPGDAVLLSPACSSFDQFTNYERRGETFRALVAAP